MEKKIIRKARRRKKKSVWKWIAGGLFILVLAAYLGWLYPFWGMPFNGQRHGNPPLTPPWALECWLWEDDANTAARVDELVAGYASHDIPVRTLLLDSPWSTRYNDFQVDTLRYPHPQKWFKALQEKGYRVVLWMTCMVNSRNKDTRIRDAHTWYDWARQKGYLAGDGFQVTWWKGTGGFVDYANPIARKWWHNLQEQVFALGIDGWKLDGTATYFSSKLGPIPLPYQETANGLRTTRQYMDAYYREEYRHGLRKNPGFVTLARAIDTPWAHPEGFAPI
ncbi:MAG: glycoside hydrolase family 31 protein, partial [Calditrichaeota bacterium]|nr:glycoside hydrolase family 31 protein [Calditrichota bacterium]